MSADNTIAIILFSDQARVEEQQNIDDVYSFYSTKCNKTQNIDLYQIYARFKDVPVFKTKEDAFSESARLEFQAYDEGSYIEYGTQIIADFDFTWDEFVLKAKEVAKLEYEALQNKNKYGIIIIMSGNF